MGRDLSELRALEAARARLADGSYGICAECAAAIWRRAPACALPRCASVDCQRVHEKTFAGPSTRALIPHARKTHFVKPREHAGGVVLSLERVVGAAAVAAWKSDSVKKLSE